MWGGGGVLYSRQQCYLCTVQGGVRGLVTVILRKFFKIIA